MKKPSTPEPVDAMPRGLENQPQRRLILPAKKLQADLKLTAEQVTPDHALQDALKVVGIDIARYKNKVTQEGKMLTLPESRILQGHIRALVEMKKEMREQDRADDLSKLSQEELFSLARKALSALPEIPEAEIVRDPDDSED